MNKKPFLIFTLINAIVIASSIVLVSLINRGSSEKTAYQLYLETHPGYTGSEDEWLYDLLNNKLGVSRKEYVVHFDSRGGSAVDDQVVIEGDKVKKPDDPVKTGYEFKEWSFNGEPWVFYGYSVSSDITLEAVWDLTNYSIEYDLDGGYIAHGDNPTSYTIIDELAIISPQKDGYDFCEWVDQNGNTIASIKEGSTGDLSLTAIWSPCKNHLLVTSQSSIMGSVSVLKGSGYTDEEVVVEAHPISPYSFKGWQDSNKNIISSDFIYSFIMPPHDFELCGIFGLIKNVEIEIDSDYGTAYGSGQYFAGDKVTLECVEKEGECFKGWYDSGDNCVSRQLIYSFVMPEDDCLYKAVFMTPEEKVVNEWEKSHGVIPVFNDNNSKVTYGMYPQSHISDNELINNLDKFAVKDSTGFYYYENDYYQKIVASPVNLGFDNKGNKNYVYFDDGTKIIDGDSYWFKVEPVSWDILSTNDNEHLLISTMLLDVHNYHSSYNDRDIGGNVIFANNYKYSGLRDWLISDFYHNVFALGDGDVKQTTVDNSPHSTEDDDNIYACEDTVDKMFVPSYRDYLNKEYGFDPITNGSNTRIVKTTEYSRALGAWVSQRQAYYNCGYSWLRTPVSDSPIESWRLSYGGGMNRNNDIIDDSTCVRPMVVIKPY